jgi:heme oxygenase
MGTLAKHLGKLQNVLWMQQGAMRLESESRNIIRTMAANKVPDSLSFRLDQTLKEGHDMKVFGLGTAASMASRPRYARFTASMHRVYSAMEAELDKASPTLNPATYRVWTQHGEILRRASALEADLADVQGELGGGELLSPATDRYVEGIRLAGKQDRWSGGARLLGHLYCRYFADLFGGQALATPYRVALTLELGTPRHYSFSFPEGGRREYIADIYTSLNFAGEMLTVDEQENVVKEALKAFRHNVDVYSEEPVYLDGVKGVVNICSGYVASQARGA